MTFWFVPTAAVGGARLDLELKGLVVAPSNLHPNPDQRGTGFLGPEFRGQLRTGIGG